jgi:hypothetical protein
MTMLTSPRTSRYPLSNTLILASLALVTILGTECADPSTHSSLVEPGRVLLAKGKPVDTNSRANLVWADSVLMNGNMVAAGIGGDGRLKDGSPSSGSPSNEYQAAWCGVSAFFASGTDLNFKPNSSWTTSMQSACGSQRLYTFYWNGPDAPGTTNGPHSIAYGLGSLTVGQSVSQSEAFGVQLQGCDILMFSDSARYTPSNSPRQTRLPDVIVNGVTERQWRIESQGTHQGACVTYNHNGSVKSVGPWYVLPFSLTVTEVSYPWSSYP